MNFFRATLVRCSLCGVALAHISGKPALWAFLCDVALIQAEMYYNIVEISHSRQNKGLSRWNC